MGVQYHARQVARDALLKSDITPVIDTRLRKLLFLLKKLRLVRGEKRLVQKLLNADFMARIAATRYSYTCGSALDMPIRKFFEIPASGSVLVCRPFHGFKDAGFIDGKNCMIVEPEQIIDAHRSLLADPDLAQRLASSGQHLVMEKHSLDARSRHLASIVEAIAQGRFKGSHWMEGEHRLRTAALGSAA
jgi:hypothetical protein